MVNLSLTRNEKGLGEIVEASRFFFLSSDVNDIFREAAPTEN